MALYLRFHVELLEVRSSLWRRFLLDKRATFGDLHLAIQDACGWGNHHLFDFVTARGGETIAGVPDEDWGESCADAGTLALTSFFEPRGRQACVYRYDFGDGWQHRVTYEGIERLRDRFARRLLAGEGTFPPEDCGGPHGYARCVAAVTGRGWRVEYGDDVERAGLLEWLEGWRPDAFELERVRRQFDA
jgi:hypothetical protein